MSTDRTKVILVVNSLFPNWGNEDKNILNAVQNIDQLKKVFFDKRFFDILSDDLISIEDKTAQEILFKSKEGNEKFNTKNTLQKIDILLLRSWNTRRRSQTFFASRDTIREHYEITSVDSKLLFTYLQAFCAKELIVILDCCYAAQSTENLGGADSLIEKSLPPKIRKPQPQENGTYYLFAADKDNVAKFNPKQSTQPTYFTSALLAAINSGTQPGNPFIKMGELYDQLVHEIKKLQAQENTDIPDPRPGLHGNVNGFLFCKNIKYQNEEDQAWEKVRANPMIESIAGFIDTFPNGKYFDEASALVVRISDGFGKFNQAANNIGALSEVAKEYKDIPAIKLNFSKKMKEFLINLKQKEAEISGEKTKTAESQNTSSELVNAGTISEARPTPNESISIRDTTPQSPTMREVKKKEENTVTV